RARVSWSARAAQLFKEIARQSSSLRTEDGRTIPFSSLRSAILVSVPEASLLEADLGSPWSKDARDPRPFLDAAIEPKVLMSRTCSAIDVWCQLELAPW